eukprot:s347_g12.t1
MPGSADAEGAGTCPAGRPALRRGAFLPTRLEITIPPACCTTSPRCWPKPACGGAKVSSQQYVAIGLITSRVCAVQFRGAFGARAPGLKKRFLEFM